MPGAAGAARAGHRGKRGARPAQGDRVLRESCRQLLGGLLRIGHVIDLVGRQQQPDLQLKQRSDQHEELARALEVDLTILLDLREVAQADVGDGNLTEIDDVAEDEREQEVERAGERLEVEIQLEGGGGHRNSG